MDVIDRIRYYQNKLEWNDHELSKRTEIPEGTISSWRRFGSEPRVTTIERICETMGISLLEFFDVDGISQLPRELTLEEKQLVGRWNKLNEVQKSVILSLVECI